MSLVSPHDVIAFTQRRESRLHAPSRARRVGVSSPNFPMSRSTLNVANCHPKRFNRIVTFMSCARKSRTAGSSTLPSAAAEDGVAASDRSGGQVSRRHAATR